MKRLLLSILPVAALLFAHPVLAQDIVSARVVSVCGTPNNTPVVGNAYPLTQDTTLTLCTAGGGGGGGGAVTIADGADVAQGDRSDAAWSGSGDGTMIAIAKATRTALGSPLQAGGNLGTVTAVTSITNPVAVTGTFWQATQPVSGTVAATQSGTWNITNVSGTVSLPTGAATAANQTSIIGTKAAGTAAASSLLAGGVYNTSLPTLTNGQQAALQFDASGRLYVVEGTQGTGSTYNPPSGGAGSLGYLSGIYAAAIDTTPVAVNLAAAATGGCTAYGYQSAASTNSTNIKASAGTLCSLNIINTTATVYYFRLYNLSTAPTCSSATGFIKTVPIPASTTGAGVALNLGAFGEAYGTGLGFCLTGGGSSTDNTNAATGVYVMASYL